MTEELLNRKASPEAAVRIHCARLEPRAIGCEASIQTNRNCTPRGFRLHDFSRGSTGSTASDARRKFRFHSAVALERDSRAHHNVFRTAKQATTSESSVSRGSQQSHELPYPVRIRKAVLSRRCHADRECKLRESGIAGDVCRRRFRLGMVSYPRLAYEPTGCCRGRLRLIQLARQRSFAAGAAGYRSSVVLRREIARRLLPQHVDRVDQIFSLVGMMTETFPVAG